MQIYLDGLERSGNVYLSYVIGLSTGIKLNSLRTHSVETLKKYKGSDPFIVPVRDALDSITSAIIFRKYVFDNKMFGDLTGSEAKIERIIKRYKEYTDYLVDNEQFFIAPFHEFTKDHNLIIEKITKFYPEWKDVNKIHKLSKEDIFLKIKEKQDEYYYHPELGNFPRQESKEKYQIKNLLLEKYSDDIDYIQSNVNILYKRYEAI